MRNYVRIGPVAIKVNSKGIAFWGYPRIQIGGLSLWLWSNTREFMPASYHPDASITWLWSWRLTRRKSASHTHNNGGDKVYWLPFGWRLVYSWQHPMWKDGRDD